MPYKIYAIKDHGKHMWASIDKSMLKNLLTYMKIMRTYMKIVSHKEYIKTYIIVDLWNQKRGTWELCKKFSNENKSTKRNHKSRFESKTHVWSKIESPLWDLIKPHMEYIIMHE